MADLEDETVVDAAASASATTTASTATTTPTDENSNERRGCKRRLEGESSKEARHVTPKNVENDCGSEANSAKEDSMAMTIPQDETETVAIDLSQAPTNLPNGMALEWNSQKTRATLTVSDSLSTNRELRVCLVGRAKIRVVEGSAEVLGHRMEGNHDSACSIVTSPYWSSWMTIEATSLPCKIELECIRGPESFWVTAPKRPIVLPESWRACADGIVQDFSSPEHNKRAAFDSLEDYEGIETRRICMITGAKGVGKSTLLRYLTNRILSNDPDGEVAILDTDVGQPELAPPGILRLAIVRKPLLQPPYWNLVGMINHDEEIEEEEEMSNTSDDENDEQGPSYGPQLEHARLAESTEDDSNNVEVISSVFFGTSTSKVDPTRYIDAIQFLMEKYKTEVIHNGRYPIPLLINMDGWVKGVGYEILSALSESLEPTHLVQILGDAPGQIFHLPTAMESSVDQPITQTEMENTSVPKVFKLDACQTMQGASLCRIPAFTMRNFRWATYFLPNELQTIDAWDFVSADSLQTGWIAATNSDKTTTVPHWWHTSHIEDDTDKKTDEEGKLERNDDCELNDDCRLAKALAGECPYCVPMEAVDAFVIGSDFEDCLRVPEGETDTNIINETYDRIYQALNGRIVSLCTNTSTMESLGYGILRSIDWEKRLLYILVPPSVVSESNQSLEVLSRVTALVGGNLPLPMAMLYRGVYAESFPYLASVSKQPILGSEPMKSRNNIGRRGLANAERNSN